VVYVLKYIDDNPQFVEFFRTSWCPEESLIHTIIGNSTFLKSCQPNLTYMDWNANPSPALIDRKHIELLRRKDRSNDNGQSGPFFARKFSDRRPDIVELVDRELRHG